MGPKEKPDEKDFLWCASWAKRTAPTLGGVGGSGNDGGGLMLKVSLETVCRPLIEVIERERRCVAAAGLFTSAPIALLMILLAYTMLSLPLDRWWELALESILSLANWALVSGVLWIVSGKEESSSWMGNGGVITDSLGIGESIPMVRPSLFFPSMASPLVSQMSPLRWPSTAVIAVLMLRLYSGDHLCE